MGWKSVLGKKGVRGGKNHIKIRGRGTKKKKNAKKKEERKAKVLLKKKKGTGKVLGRGVA